MKSGVEHLSQHPGWKSKTKLPSAIKNRELIAALRGAASALEHGRNATARKKLAVITEQDPKIADMENLVQLVTMGNTESDQLEAMAREILGTPIPDLTDELAALHDLQADCQVALRDVPHQKGCIFWDTRPVKPVKVGSTLKMRPLVGSTVTRREKPPSEHGVVTGVGWFELRIS